MLLRAFLVCWFLPGLLIAWLGAFILPPLSPMQIVTLLVVFVGVTILVWARSMPPYLRRACEQVEAGKALKTFPAFLVGVLPFEVFQFRLLQTTVILALSIIGANAMESVATRVAGELIGAICWGIALFTLFTLIWKTASPWLRYYRLEMLFERLAYQHEGPDELSELIRVSPIAMTAYERELLWIHIAEQRELEERGWYE